MKKGKKLSIAVLKNYGLTIKDFLKVYNDFLKKLNCYEVTERQRELIPTSQLILNAYDECEIYKNYNSLIQEAIQERKDYFTSEKEVASLIMTIITLEKLYC